MFRISSSLLLIFLLFFAGCSSGGGSSNNNSSSTSTTQTETETDTTVSETETDTTVTNLTYTVTGKAIDGALHGSKICIDVDENGLCGSDETIISSDENGNYQLSVTIAKGTTPILAVNGTDTATYEPFAGVFKNVVEFDDATAITNINATPITTLVAELYLAKKAAGTPITKAEAIRLISEALQVSLSVLENNPMEDKTLFQANQKIVLMSELLGTTYRSVDSTLSKADAFSKVTKAMALSAAETGFLSQTSVAAKIESDNGVTFGSNQKTFSSTTYTALSTILDSVNTTDGLENVQAGIKIYMDKCTVLLSQGNSADFSSLTLPSSLSSLLSEGDDERSSFTNPISYVETATLEGSIDLSSFRSISRAVSDNGYLYLIPSKFYDPITVPVNDDGSYKATGLHPGANYQLVYILGEKGIKIDDIALSPGEEKVQDITQIEPVGWASLTVTNGTSPLEGATVLVEETGMTFTTNSEGVATITGLPPGSYTLTVSKENFSHTYKEFQIIASTGTDIGSKVLSDSIGTVTGTILLPQSTRDETIIVYIATSTGEFFSTTAGSDGNFILSNIPTGGPYSLVAEAHGFQSKKVDEITVSKNTITNIGTLLLAALNTTDDSTPSNGSIEGFVRLDGESNHGGVLVSISGTSFETVTSLDGSYIINKVPAGNYTVSFSKEGFVSTSKSASIIAGSSTKVTKTTLIVKDTTILRWGETQWGVAKWSAD